MTQTRNMALDKNPSKAFERTGATPFMPLFPKDRPPENCGQHPDDTPYRMKEIVVHKIFFIKKHFIENKLVIL